MMEHSTANTNSSAGITPLISRTTSCPRDKAARS
jgi:hypothetical protein